MFAGTYFAPYFPESFYSVGFGPSGYFAPRYFAGSYFAPRYFATGSVPGGWFAHDWFASRYYASRYYSPVSILGGSTGGSAGGWFAHNFFGERWYPSWYYCPATARSSLIGLRVIEKPRVLLTPSRFLDWWVLCKPYVSFAASNFHRVRWEVVESPFVEFEPTVTAKHGEFNIIEKPHVEFVARIGQSGECISADGSAGTAEVSNAVY